MLKRCYIGIDPGKTGAACALPSLRTRKPDILKFNEDYYELWRWVRKLTRKYHELYAVIELVHGGAFRGLGRSSPRSMFTFGFHTGFANGILVGLSIPVCQVSPLVWQKDFKLLKRNNEKPTAKKRRHTVKAKQIYPESHIIGQTADAVLLANYCRRNYKEFF